MFGKLLLGTALATAQAQSAPPPDCVTDAEFGALVAVVLPYMVEASVTECRRHLPEGAFLRGNTAEIVARWRQQTASAEQQASAAAAFGKFAGIRMEANDPDQMRVLSRMMANVVTRGLGAAKCGQVNRLIEAMAPLPAANLSQIMSALAVLTATNGRIGSDGPPLCPA